MNLVRGASVHFHEIDSVRTHRRGRMSFVDDLQVSPGGKGEAGEALRGRHPAPRPAPPPPLDAPAPPGTPAPPPRPPARSPCSS